MLSKNAWSSQRAPEALAGLANRTASMRTQGCNWMLSYVPLASTILCHGRTSKMLCSFFDLDLQ